jgi:predicted HicB family RNase H-like nuclease
MTSNNRLTFKGFTATIEFSAEDMLLVGQVDDIDSLIMFSAENPADLATEFHAAIEQYLADCAAHDVAPEKPCKGTFNVRIGTDLHRKAAGSARRRGQSLNDFVKSAIAQAVDSAEVIGVGTAVLFESRAALPAGDLWGPTSGGLSHTLLSQSFPKPN